MAKKDRVNAFIMTGAQERATVRVLAALKSTDFKLGTLNEKEFKATMDAIRLALMVMYSHAMCDTLDVVEGRPLTEVK